MTSEINLDDYKFISNEEQAELNQEVSKLDSQIAEARQAVETLVRIRDSVRLEIDSGTSAKNADTLNRLRSKLEEIHGIEEGNPMGDMLWMTVINSTEMDAAKIVDRYAQSVAMTFSKR